ncbi:MAG: (Fe-S)-binding protein [Dehalococcoidia bacterium]|nr:(Fe-S)-binding protein [Dehalococcoidia bacterium]
METVAPFKEIIDAIKANGGEAFWACYQCGLCDTVCPWNRVRNFSMRKIVREAIFGLTEIESEDIWRCTTCGKCPQVCPRDVKQIESGVALRRLATEYGVFPPSVQSIKSVSASLRAEGNPLNEDRAKRAKWAEGLGVKPFTEGMEVLYFPGCYLSYDPRAQKIAKATVEILDKAGVEFGILGSDESCCGESIRKTGDTSLFESLARSNIDTFNRSGVTEIIATSPHCYTTFKNEYPALGGSFKVTHFTQYLAGLIDRGQLQFTRELKKKVVYHDPCYLGRHNGIYDEPRKVLASIPGVELMDEVDSRENSLCCSGGGGRIFMETKKGERFSDILVEQAMARGADVLATACPYCLLNFKDSLLTTENSDRMEIKDVSELVQEAV